jgi:hypothetical protein
MVRNSQRLEAGARSTVATSGKDQHNGRALFTRLGKLRRTRSDVRRGLLAPLRESAPSSYPNQGCRSNSA